MTNTTFTTAFHTAYLQPAASIAAVLYPASCAVHSVDRTSVPFVDFGRHAKQPI
jgi:hypothetical protein